MIYELVIVLCLNANECVTFRKQMPKEECVIEAERHIDKYGYEGSPYLKETPRCVEVYDG